MQQVLDNVYRERFANRYLASFTSFAYEQSSDEYIKQLVEKCFDDFFINQISYYDNDYINKEIALCGSVASVFQEQVNIIAKKYKRQIKKIEKSPLQGLLDYHKPYGEPLIITK